MKLDRPALFVAREDELERAIQAFERFEAVALLGVAGVGKSAMAQALASSYSGPVVASRARDDSLSSVINDARHLLSEDEDGAIVDLANDDERLDELAAQLNDLGALWFLDDIHRLPAEDRQTLLEGLKERLTRGRFLCTSRERLPRGGEAHFELRLTGLSKTDAERLWQKLDEIYGDVEGFEIAFAVHCFHLNCPFMSNIPGFEDVLSPSVACLNKA